MTDRELLEWAAKAAGIDGEWEPHPDYAGVSTSGIYIEGRAMLWNPLTDDGDALRLAVRCVQLFGFYQFMRAWLIAMATEQGDVSDPYAATRRAIVRAAVAALAGGSIAQEAACKSKT